MGFRDNNSSGYGGGGRSSGGRSFGGGGRDSRGGGRSFGGGGRDSRGGGRDFGGRREMVDAICDECGKSCQLPFKPSGEKPVYCSDCFEARGNSSNDGYARRSSGGRDSYRSNDRDFSMKSTNFADISKDDIQAISDKLDKVIAALERIAPTKTVREEAEDAEIKLS